MKILIIDDEKEILSLLSQWLSERGHEVTSITGGAHAASWVKNKGFNLVLLDIRLPDTNGLDEIASIVDAGAKVIVMSGLLAETWADLAIQKGASDYLAKPISLPKLQRILDRLAVSTE